MPFVHFIFTSGTCPGPWWGNSRGNGARGRGQTMLNESRLVLNSLELSWRNSNMLELSRTIMIWIDMDWYSILELILDPGSFVCVHVCSFQKYNISRGYPVPPDSYILWSLLSIFQHTHKCHLVSIGVIILPWSSMYFQVLDFMSFGPLMLLHVAYLCIYISCRQIWMLKRGEHVPPSFIHFWHCVHSM